jgi:hypothetical protein
MPVANVDITTGSEEALWKSCNKAYTAGIRVQTPAMVVLLFFILLV